MWRDNNLLLTELRATLFYGHIGRHTLLKQVLKQPESKYGLS